MTTTTLPTNPHVWNTPATIALCISGPLAVYAASHRSLKKYVCRAQTAASDADTKIKAVETPSEPESGSSADSGARPQSTRSKWANWLKITALFSAMLSIGFGIGFGLPYMATPTLLDVFWLLFMTYNSTRLVQWAINTALPDPRVMDVHWTSWNSITWTTTGPNPEPPVPITRARLTAAVSLALLCISGVYNGHTWLMCIPVMAFVYDQVSCLAVPDRKYGNMIKWVAYFQAGLSAIILTGLGTSSLYKHYFSSDSDTDVSKPSKFSQPSPEVLALMTMYQKGMPLIASGVFVALGLRFDYAQASKTMGDLVPTDATQRNSHDITIPSFPRPIFREGMKVYFLQLALFGLTYRSSLPSYIKDSLTIVDALCLPVWPVVARQILVAKRLGILQQLMDYSEPRAQKNQSAGEGENENGEDDVPRDVEKATLLAADKA